QAGSVDAAQGVKRALRMTLALPAPWTRFGHIPDALARFRMMKPLCRVLGTVVLSLCAATHVAAQKVSTDTDPFLWLESLNGPKALAWVKAENAKTLGVLQPDKNFAGFYAEALRIA